MKYHTPAQSGFTFVELIFVAGLSVLIFGGLFTAFQFTLDLIAQSRAKLSAISLANERMEFFRSLPYDQVGTLTGVIRGPVANNQVLSLNNIDFTERIVIDYVDGVGDGVDGADINGILQDYKQIKLEYSWSLGGNADSMSVVSNIMPRSIETNVGGGSIRVNVIDQDFLPVNDAVVQISNASTTAPLYESRRTNGSGEVVLSGVPEDSNYEIIVGGPIAGSYYSTSSTYIADSYVPNPDKPAFSVSEGGISTQTFIIDELSDITITALDQLLEASVLEEFVDASGIASTTDTTTVDTGDAVLVNTLGVYETTGTVFLTPVVPASAFERWEVIRVAVDLDPNTSATVRLYTGDASTAYTLIPDSELPGNSLGFTDNLIDLSDLDPGLYPTTTIGITLSTTDTSVTPEVEEVEIFWRESSNLLTGQDLYIRGDKILGTGTDGSAIYKSTTTQSTDGSGQIILEDMEFDIYTVTALGALDLASACPAAPFVHRGGEDSEVELVYVPPQSHTLRVAVQDALGRAIPGASVRLDRSGYDVTQQTNVCGQTLFTGGVSQETDYDLEITAAGFATQIISPFSISGAAATTIILSP